jgi:hypothetical protein
MAPTGLLPTHCSKAPLWATVRLKSFSAREGRSCPLRLWRSTKSSTRALAKATHPPSAAGPCGSPCKLAGVARDAEGLEQLASYLATAAPGGLEQGPGAWELANMAQVGRAVVALARRRCESRGAHWRTDYPAQHPEWRVRQVAQLLSSGELGIGNLEVAGQYAGNAEVGSLPDPASDASAAVAAV